MECVIESVMELMVHMDTHTQLCSVCMQNYFYHYNYYYCDYDGFAFYCENSHMAAGCS